MRKVYLVHAISFKFHTISLAKRQMHVSHCNIIVLSHFVSLYLRMDKKETNVSYMQIP